MSESVYGGLQAGVCGWVAWGQKVCIAVAWGQKVCIAVAWGQKVCIAVAWGQKVCIAALPVLVSCNLCKWAGLESGATGMQGLAHSMHGREAMVGMYVSTGGRPRLSCMVCCTGLKGSACCNMS
jgi:hypothetical protein